MCFIRTSPFRDAPQFSRSITVPLRYPSADTAVIVSAALSGLRAIYLPGFKLAKAGVMLLDLQPDTVNQGEMFVEPGKVQNKNGLMATLDGLNQRFGPGTVHIASAGAGARQRAWSMKQERRTPRYTTCWADLLVVHA